MPLPVDRSAPGVRIYALPFGPETEERIIDLGERLISFKYTDTIKGDDKVELVLNNFDLLFFDEEDGLLNGALLQVQWGYAGYMSPPHIVIIREVKGFSRLKVMGHGQGSALDSLDRCRAFEGMTRSEVVETVAAENGFGPEARFIQETTRRFEVITQDAESDAKFMRRLARLQGYEFHVSRDGLHWEERRYDKAPEHVFTWYGGRGSLMGVDVESNLIRRIGRARTMGRDPLEKVDVESSADSGSVNRPTLAAANFAVAVPAIKEVVDEETGAITLVREYEETTDTSEIAGKASDVVATNNASEIIFEEPPGSQDEADERARALFRVAERDSVKLNVTVVGDPTISSGINVEFRKIGRLWAGLYHVHEATHSITPGNYTINMKCATDGVNELQSGAQPHGDGADINTGEVPSTAEDASQGDEPPQLTEVDVVDEETGAIRTELREL